MKRRKGQLRAQAGAAKTRLVTGFWNEPRPMCELKKTYDIYYGKTDIEEEKFYTRVAELIDLGKNPLSHVLDREYMSALDDSGRERYVLSIGARVRKCVERYNQVC